MAITSNSHLVVGSERQPVPGPKPISGVWLEERIEVTMRLRAKAPMQTTAAGSYLDNRHPGARTYLSREQHAASYDADKPISTRSPRLRRRTAWSS
jgi:hypothetical protein